MRFEIYEGGRGTPLGECDTEEEFEQLVSAFPGSGTCHLWDKEAKKMVRISSWRNGQERPLTANGLAQRILMGGLPRIAQVLAELVEYEMKPLIDRDAARRRIESIIDREPVAQSEAKPTKREPWDPEECLERENQALYLYNLKPGTPLRIDWPSSSDHGRDCEFVRETRRSHYGMQWVHEWAGIVRFGDGIEKEFGPCVVPAPEKPGRIYTEPEPLPIGRLVKIVELGEDQSPQHAVGQTVRVVDDWGGIRIATTGDDVGALSYFVTDDNGRTYVRSVSLIEDAPGHPAIDPEEVARNAYVVGYRNALNAVLSEIPGLPCDVARRIRHIRDRGQRRSLIEKAPVPSDAPQSPVEAPSDG